MRVRKKRNGERRLAACAHLLTADPAHVFGETDKPLRVEIGCGKGRFITETAVGNPGYNFIAVELVTDVIMLAMEKAMALEGGCPDNLRFYSGNADRIDELFPEHSIDRIYLNFSDPWPKARHAKRRLTYRSFFARYARVLCDGGDLAIKTDNDGLFDFTLEELAEAGWTVLEQTRDLHASPYAEGNVMTEYEMAFSEKGKNINYVRALPPTEQTEHASSAPLEQTETAETAEAERA